MVGHRLGMGTEEALAQHTQGYTYTLPVGAYTTPEVVMGVGTPQGSVQGVQSAATAAAPIVRYVQKAHAQYRVAPMKAPLQMWVDDTVNITRRAPEGPAQGMVVDQ